jgi:branched-chain amino acid transport system ATP-binding protein
VEQTFHIIAESRKEGTPVQQVAQHANAALEMCDRSYVLESGGVTLPGTGPELISNPHVRRAYLGG